MSITDSKSNIYGESTSKRWTRGVQIPGLIDRKTTSVAKDLQTVNVEQSADFHLLRTECRLRNILPEPGDIIEFDSEYYEINNTNDVQLIAGQSIYNHSITCHAHLTRMTGLQLESPII